MGRRPRIPRRSQTKKSALLPIVLVVVVVAVIFATMFLLKRDEIDSATSCPKSGPESVTAVILDTSDPLAPHQIAAFDKFANSLIAPPKDEEIVTENSDSRNYVQKGQLLVAYELADETGQPTRIFMRCNPGNPEMRNMQDTLTEGEILARIRWSRFTKELLSVFPKEKLQGTAPTSPIIETIRYVRRAEFQSSSDLKASGKSAGVIFIVSDMLQNSDRLSHFGEELPAVKNVPADFALDLTGIDIGIRYLKSDKYTYLQPDSHFTWWRKFFAIAGSPLNRPPEKW